MVALQNDRLRSMPASFLPPSPVNKPGTEVLLTAVLLQMARGNLFSYSMYSMMHVMESSAPLWSLVFDETH